MSQLSGTSVPIIRILLVITGKTNIYRTTYSIPQCISINSSNLTNMFMRYTYGMLLSKDNTSNGRGYINVIPQHLCKLNLISFIGC